jgi:uncharacterized membrane protein YkvA (DUF1232 family)
MKITKTEVKLKSQDLISIIEEFVEVPNLNITEIIIDNSLKIEGNYKFGRTIKFSVSLAMHGYNRDSITFSLQKVKVSKIGVFNWIKKIVLNKLLNKLDIGGVKGEGDLVTIELNKIMDLLPIYLKIDLNTFEINNDELIVAVENIVFHMKKPNEKAENMKKIDEENIAENMVFLNRNKVEDKYTIVREKIGNKAPDKFEKVIEYAFLLPDILALFYRLFKDKRVPLKIKLIIGGVIGYLASPIDILPDFVPFVGKLDDLALAFYALDKVINDISPIIIMENWQGDFKSIKKIQQGIKYINRAAGGANVDKLVHFAEKVYEFSKEDIIIDEEKVKKETN